MVGRAETRPAHLVTRPRPSPKNTNPTMGTIIYKPQDMPTGAVQEMSAPAARTGPPHSTAQREFPLEWPGFALCLSARWLFVAVGAAQPSETVMVGSPCMETVRVAAAAAGAVVATYLTTLVVTATGVAPFGVGPLGTDPSAAAVLFVAGVVAFVCGLGLLGRRLDGLDLPRGAWYTHHVAMTPLCVCGSDGSTGTSSMAGLRRPAAGPAPTVCSGRSGICCWCR